MNHVETCILFHEEFVTGSDSVVFHEEECYYKMSLIQKKIGLTQRISRRAACITDSRNLAHILDYLI